jgi:hypothetical protein
MTTGLLFSYNHPQKNSTVLIALIVADTQMRDFNYLVADKFHYTVVLPSTRWYIRKSLNHVSLIFPSLRQGDSTSAVWQHVWSSRKLQTAASSGLCSFAYGCVEGFKLPNRMMPSADIYRVVQRQKKEKLYKNT